MRILQRILWNFHFRNEQALNKNIYRVVLTGGPGGGKSTLIRELQRNPAWKGRLAVLPEAISLMGGVGISPSEQRFQRVMVSLQMALEKSLAQALGGSEKSVILCHRGSLDPLAYWLDRGWTQEDFFVFTRTTFEEHYRHYHAVIHLVTAADGATEYYLRWPDAHRPETIEDAIRIDRLLHQVWCEHPNYTRIDNQGRDWAAKSHAAQALLSGLLNED
jgi:predicted ATPase